MQDSRQPLLFNRPLLSRLIDDAPDLNYDRQYAQTISIEDLYDAIKFNLESILNARAACLHWPDSCRELATSLVNYGVHDFTHHHFANQPAQQQLCEDIKAVIEHFEPRLKDVQVYFQDDDVEIERSLLLRIEAVMNTRPAQSAVFESSLDVVKQRFNFS